METPTILLAGIGLGGFITTRALHSLMLWAARAARRPKLIDKVSRREMSWYCEFHRSV